MIKRIVYHKTNGFGYRPLANGLSEGKDELATLFETFDLHHDWMVVEKGLEQVIMWNAWDREDYSNEDDIPNLTLSQDDTGWITLQAKDELSFQDLEAIEHDRKAGQEWGEDWKKKFGKK